MYKSTIPGLIVLAACFSATPSIAQQGQTPAPVAGLPASPVTKSASCLDHIQNFNAQLAKDGHWLGGSGYGFGYPASGFWLGGSGFILAPMQNYATGVRVNARSGYEVRTLLAAATILARTSKQQPCEDVLSAAGDVYKTYVSDLRKRQVPVSNTTNWRERQIADAKPVSQQTLPMRSDELLGTELRNAKNEPLGSVDDLILDPGTGKIAYLVIARGGLFGIGGEYVPVPWGHFKITPKLDLLVLDATRGVMEDAPRVDFNLFGSDDTTAQDQKSEAYWKAHLTDNDD